MVLGWDAAATVDALGPGVTEPRVGQRVLGVAQQLAARAERRDAEYVVLDVEQLTPTPDGFYDATAALPSVGFTTLREVLALALELAGEARPLADRTLRLAVSRSVGFDAAGEAHAVLGAARLAGQIVPSA